MIKDRSIVLILVLVHGSGSGPTLCATRRSDWAANEALLPWLPSHTLTPPSRTEEWFTQVLAAGRHGDRLASWCQSAPGGEGKPGGSRRNRGQRSHHWFTGINCLSWSIHTPSSSLTYWDLLGPTEAASGAGNDSEKCGVLLFSAPVAGGCLQLFSSSLDQFLSSLIDSQLDSGLAFD